MSDSPVVVIFDAEGNEVTVEDGGSLPSTSSGIPVVGKTGTTAKIVQVDSEGRPVVVGSGTAGNSEGGVLSVQGVTSGTPVPISGNLSGNMSVGVISGEIDVNQGLPISPDFRWAVGISDGTDFVGTQSNPIKVGDDFSAGEVLAQQSGSDSVLTFTFSSAVNFVFIESSGAGLVSRANPFGGTPTSTSGIPCRNEQVREVKINTTIVRVYAPTGTTINVWGMRR